MPCRCDGYEDMEQEERQKTTDQLTQDLCYLCGTLLEAGDLNKHASSRIIKWWIQHQKDDTNRVRENLREVLIDYFVYIFLSFYIFCQLIHFYTRIIS